jgi:hypothetical protein
MTTFTSHALELDHKFNPHNKRHSINGHDVALHCHHFTTLYTQLAIDSERIRHHKGKAASTLIIYMNTHTHTHTDTQAYAYINILL